MLNVGYQRARHPGSTCSTTNLDTVAQHNCVLARQQGLGGLRPGLPVVDSHGGLWASRERTGSGFARPSVYSADLIKLISRVRHIYEHADQAWRTRPAAWAVTSRRDRPRRGSQAAQRGPRLPRGRGVARASRSAVPGWVAGRCGIHA
ncbi:hypothetical protein Misp03_36030 [Microbispora sp. NBRC 16548]|nr:hypothetical protein Misp03_36030 [Microbispora sp. NBRC 16548]